MADETPSGKKITIGVPRETAEHERRVALTPDAVKKYVAAGVPVLVQKDAGKGAFISDATFENAGAKIVDDAASIYKDADLVLKVQKPTKAEIDEMLARLQALSDDHFNCAPDEAGWAMVGTLEHYASLLKRITDSAFGEGEHAR